MPGFDSLIAKLKAKLERQEKAVEETKLEIAALEKANAKR